MKLIVDNGAAYRASSLQGICARLGSQLIFCRPRDPQSKGKLERWHRTLRAQFLSEIALCEVPLDLNDLNARLWAYIEGIYHRTPHEGLDGQTPLERYQKDLEHIRPLGSLAAQLEAIFQHRVDRLVRKNSALSYKGRFFEVPHELEGKTVEVAVDPHSKKALWVEDEAGKQHPVTPLDALANRYRKRNKPVASTEAPQPRILKRDTPTLVELACAQHYQPISSEDDASDEFTAKGL